MWRSFHKIKVNNGDFAVYLGSTTICWQRMYSTAVVADLNSYATQQASDYSLTNTQPDPDTSTISHSTYNLYKDPGKHLNGSVNWDSLTSCREVFFYTLEIYLDWNLIVN